MVRRNLVSPENILAAHHHVLVVCWVSLVKVHIYKRLPVLTLKKTVNVDIFFLSNRSNLTYNSSVKGTKR